MRLWKKPFQNGSPPCRCGPFSGCFGRSQATSRTDIPSAPAPRRGFCGCGRQPCAPCRAFPSPGTSRCFPHRSARQNGRSSTAGQRIPPERRPPRPQSPGPSSLCETPIPVPRPARACWQLPPPARIHRSARACWRLLPDRGSPCRYAALPTAPQTRKTKDAPFATRPRHFSKTPASPRWFRWEDSASILCFPDRTHTRARFADPPSPAAAARGVLFSVLFFRANRITAFCLSIRESSRAPVSSAHRFSAGAFLKYAKAQAPYARGRNACTSCASSGPPRAMQASNRAAKILARAGALGTHA